MGRSSGMDGYGISRPPPGFDPGPSSPWRVAIMTELSRPLNMASVGRINVEGGLEERG